MIHLQTITPAQLAYLLKVEAAAIVWLQSLEGDGWSYEDIRSGICRPGMSELMQLLLDRGHGVASLPAMILPEVTTP
jgi:hypothetical protein